MMLSMKGATARSDIVCQASLAKLSNRFSAMTPSKQMSAMAAVEMNNWKNQPFSRACCQTW